MRAYLGYVDHSGLAGSSRRTSSRGTCLRGLVLSWTSRSTIVLWAVVADEDAEAIHRELGAGRPGAACDLLSARAVEVLPIAYASHETDHTPDPQPAI